MHSAGARVAKTSTALLGHVSLLCEQRNRLEELRRAVSQDVDIVRPLSDGQLSDMQGDARTLVCQKGKFSVSIEITTAFVKGIKSWARSVFEALPAQSKSSVIYGVARTTLALVARTESVVAERQADNTASHEDFPPVLPHQPQHVAPFRFQELFQLYRQRLEATLSVDQIDVIEKEHRDFRDDALNEAHLRRRLQAATDKFSFQEAWAGLHGRWPNLSTFCGGLVTIFPVTATVESDFSIVNFEETAGRQVLTDFSLEGILQAEQYDKLRALNIPG